MQVTAILVVIYGVLLIVGGILGFTQAQSTPSLIMGAFLGTLMIINGWIIWKDHLAGPKWAMLLSAFLLVFFGFRFYLTQKFMPSGLMALISLAMVCALLPALLKKRFRNY